MGFESESSILLKFCLKFADFETFRKHYFYQKFDFYIVVFQVISWIRISINLIKVNNHLRDSKDERCYSILRAQNQIFLTFPEISKKI